VSAPPPISQVAWIDSVRIIPSHYPPIDLFEGLYDDSDEQQELFELEAMTNDRLRQEAGDISLVPIEERLSGHGATPVMAAFTHIGFPSRFTTGNYGVYYAARHMDTAIAETAYHQTRFLRRTAETPCTVTMRAYLANVYADLHDIRERYTKSHHKTDYSAAQRLGARLRNTGSHGIVYRSARHRGGFCVALFRTSAIERRSGTVYTIQGPHFEYRFDGEAVNAYRKVTRKRWAPIPAELSIR